MDITEEKADRFVETLLTEGSKIPCDDSSKSFKESDDIPPFYDEDLFKRGQQFYHRNIFGVFSAKIFGLISILSIPSVLKILVHTRMSGSEMTAYRRYMATIFHMTIWYESDFEPGSKLWKSIAEVKKLHNSASNRGCKAGINRISQRDMALTQFGFMGYQLIRSKYFGVQNATQEEWQAYIHLWRVIGHLLGIEDRFNICRGSVAETKAICEKLLENVFNPHIEKQELEFLKMVRYLIDGLWTMQPLLNFNVIMCIMQILLRNKVTVKEKFNNLSFWEKCIFYFIASTFISLQWAPFRWYLNFGLYRDLWLMKKFPFLAYYKFGYGNSHVKILAKEA